MNMLAEIGAVLARTRRREHLSLAELAKQIEGEVTVLERLEAGQPGITTAQLDDLAEVLGLDARALRRGQEVGRPSPSVFLRHHGLQDFRDDDLPVLDTAVDQARSMGALGRMLNEAPEVWPGARFMRVDAPHDAPDAPARDGYRLANALRRFLARPTEALNDVVALAERELGIAVVVRRLSSRAVCAVKVGDTAAIVLQGSSASYPARTRATVAHEICHILHDPDREGVHVVLDLEDNKDAHADEQRARAFAAELLLPRAGLQALLGEPRQVREHDHVCELVIRAMDHFGTSWQLTANHLCNHGFEIGRAHV